MVTGSSFNTERILLRVITEAVDEAQELDLQSYFLRTKEKKRMKPSEQETTTVSQELLKSCKTNHCFIAVCMLNKSSCTHRTALTARIMASQSVSRVVSVTAKNHKRLQLYQQKSASVQQDGTGSQIKQFPLRNKWKPISGHDIDPRMFLTYAMLFQMN